MRALLLGLLLWQASSGFGTPKPEPWHFIYKRPVTVSDAGTSGQACMALDGAVYAHSAETLKDVRLYGEAAGESPHEIPYAVTQSQPAEQESASAKVLNLGKRGGRIVFDLIMPNRPYTDVYLDLSGRDFIATAAVTGANSMNGAPTSLGSFTLFDLTKQHLARSTVLHLAETRFAVLHVEMILLDAPGSSPLAVNKVVVQGASVPPSREAQIIYTAVVEASSIEQRGRTTLVTFRLPARVPVERVSFQIAPGYSGSFDRNVEISARERMRLHHPPEPDDVETMQGSIQRVHLTREGRDIQQEQMSVSAILGSNLQRDAVVEVQVENGDDAPLPLSAVRLEMRQRKVCFPVQAAWSALSLFYGDDALDAPQYDFERVLSLGSDVAVARLGPEERNPGYAARASVMKSLTERHPEVVWVGLLAVVCVLGVVAVHSARRVQG